MFPRHVCRRGAAATARRRLTRGVLVAATLILSGTIAQTANPSSGTLSPTKGASVSWVGTAPGGVSPGPQFDDHDGFCVDGITCEHFELTLTGTPAD